MSQGGQKPPDYWTFRGPATPITIHGNAAESVVRELVTLLPGWRPVPMHAGADQSVTIAIRHDAGGIHVVEHPGQGAEVLPDPFSVAYYLTTRLFEGLADTSPPGLVLHAGAVATTAGAIAFAAPATTGKSILGAAFALSGDRLLGDDRIVVRLTGSTPEALPLGLAQKLRLPLPPSLAGKLAPLLAHRSGPRIADSLFLKWDEAVQLRVGEAMRLASIVLLVRDGTSPPSWSHPSRPISIREILTLSAAPGGSSRHLAAASALVDQVPVAILRYESCFEARDAMLSNEAAVGE